MQVKKLTCRGTARILLCSSKSSNIINKQVLLLRTQLMTAFLIFFFFFAQERLFFNICYCMKTKAQSLFYNYFCSIMLLKQLTLIKLFYTDIVIA
jgi:hypothetical protein